MGIRGLTSYAQLEVGSLWTETQLKGTKLIIDGSSLLWHLYLSEGIDYQHGGNYDQLAEVLSCFFKALASNGVKPYVIIDGPTFARDKKLERIKKRFEKDIESSYMISTGYGAGEYSLLPMMSKAVFIQELGKLGIPFVICDCEADQEVASLANHWNCPVISNDSDYFIFDLPGGYIPLCSLEWKGESITGQLYERQRLSNHLKIRPEFLPLIASLVGNDFIEECTLVPFDRALFQGNGGNCRCGTKMIAIAELFSTLNNVEAALECALAMIPGENQRTTLRSALEESIKEYAICDWTLNEYFELGELRTSLKTLNQEDIPSLIMERYRKGMFPVKCMGILTSGRHFLHVQVEKSTECSAHDCSCELRRIIYAIIMKPTRGQESKKKSEVKEWSRNRRSVKKSLIQPLWEPIHGYGELPKLDDLQETETSKRQQVLLVVLKADTALIKSLPDRFQLFAATVRYWISKAKPGVNQIWVQALLLVHLKLLAERDDRKLSSKSIVRKRFLRSDIDIDCQHSFAQWQTVMMQSISLNRILLDPFIEPRISTLYNGVTAQKMVQKIKQGKEADSFLKTPDIFKQLHTAVTDGLEMYMAKEERNKELSVEPSEQSAKKQDKKTCKVLHGNPFALLCDDESEEES